MLIAIDGPSAAGKSTLGLALAEELSGTFLDTGMIFRRAAAFLSESGARPVDDPEDLRRSLAGVAAALVCPHASGPVQTPATGRGTGFTTASFAAIREVRAVLTKAARAHVSSLPGDIVVVGRDTGSSMFPEADLKFYLTAEPTERARRRAVQLSIDPRLVMQEIAERDNADASRSCSPLRQPPDAHLIDSTLISAEETVKTVLGMLRAYRPTLFL